MGALKSSCREKARFSSHNLSFGLWPLLSIIETDFLAVSGGLTGCKTTSFGLQILLLSPADLISRISGTVVEVDGNLSAAIFSSVLLSKNFRLLKNLLFLLGVLL